MYKAVKAQILMKILCDFFHKLWNNACGTIYSYAHNKIFILIK